LTKAGAVWAWGNGECTPKQIAALSEISAVAAGCGHSLALKKDGTVWAWGTNHRGQLGNGTTNNAAAPAPVTGLADITAIAAGRYHSLALRKDGTVWAWGANNEGRLGDGTSEHRLAPVQVKGLTNALAIAAGYFHSVAVRKDGTVFAWGGNESETWQLADGTTMSSTTPVPVTGQTNLPASGEAIIPTNEPPKPFTDVVKIACGAMHTLAIKSDGSLWAWGANHFWGQLGSGSAEWRTNPVRTKGLTNVVGIASGKYHNVAVLADGSVWTWGGNLYGELGNGAADSIPHPTPAPVSGLRP
jgi:alpha-tubulin suppressor-like RCC1 family protein